MTYRIPNREDIIQRVRAILLTRGGRVLFIKRVKPGREPYWVAPGGGVEDHDESLQQTLARELMEELGATADVLRPAFVLNHEKAGKNLEEHFFLCRLNSLDLRLRSGPEFNNPERGLYLPDYVHLASDSLRQINIKTDELRIWLLHNLPALKRLA
ncbi:MAG: NUDIX domain-containing protein [Chloroflexota bacterium]